MRRFAMRLTLPTLAMAFVLIGCSAPLTRQGRIKQVLVLSEPVGARIEVNGDYVGDAPLTVTIPCSLNGRFTETTKIRALPIKSGQYTQSKLFFGGFLTLRNDLVPSRLFFDMRLAPVPSNDVNVNINQ